MIFHGDSPTRARVEVNRSFLPDRAFLWVLLGKVEHDQSRDPKRNQEIGFERHLRAQESKSREKGQTKKEKERERESGTEV